MSDTKLKAPEMELTAEISHHDFDKLEIQIQEYSQGPIMSLNIHGISNVSLTYDELKNLVGIFDAYNKAKAKFTEESAW